MSSEGKYVIHATIRVDGTVARKDVVGAIFGQTEDSWERGSNLGSSREQEELATWMSV